MTLAGAFSSYPIPTPNSDPQGITGGPDGALWFTEYRGNKIGRITVKGVVTEFPVTTTDSQPYGIAAGADGALWFTEYKADQIGRITTAGAVTEFRNVYGAEPSGIVAGPDGAVWFTEYIQVARISTSGTITAWHVPYTSISPQSITRGPDGALWFTAPTSIGRMTTAGVFTEYDVLDANPLAIAAGPDGALWFTNSNSNSIGQITTAGAVSEYLAPPTNFGNTGTTGITRGVGASLWYSEAGAGMVGQALLTTASMTVNPSGGYPNTSLAFSGSRFAPGEQVTIYSHGIGSSVLASATANSSGAFSYQDGLAALPAGPYGYRVFLGVGAISGKVAAAGFTVVASAGPSPNYGPPGSVITVSGHGFSAFDTVNIYWEHPRTYLGSAVTGITGSFTSVPLTIPSSGITVADYRISATATNVPAASASATFMVTF